MIGRCHDDALWRRLVEENQERIEDPSSLANVISASIGAEGVELIKEINRALVSDCVKHKPQLRGSLSKKFAQEALEADSEQRQGQFVSKNGGGHRLPGPRRPL